MKKALVSLAAIGTLAWWLWPSANDGEAEPDRGPAVDVANRVWVDHMPKDAKDKMDVLALVDDPGLKVGSFAHTSAFEGDFSVFEFARLKPTELHITMLQSGKKHRLHAKVTKGGDCGFDYCLVLEGAPRGARRYGSQRDWVIESHAELPVRVSEIATTRGR